MSRVLPPPTAAALARRPNPPFGLAVVPFRDAVYFADDETNTLNLLHG